MNEQTLLLLLFGFRELYEPLLLIVDDICLRIVLRNGNSIVVDIGLGLRLLLWSALVFLHIIGDEHKELLFVDDKSVEWTEC